MIFFDLLPFIRQKQLASVRESGYNIANIPNPSEEVQLAAVQHTGLAIYYIKNPTEKVKIAAVTQDGHAIQYIKNPSEAVEKAAVDTLLKRVLEPELQNSKFDKVKHPVLYSNNKDTLEAIQELEEGKGKSFNSVDDLMKDLGDDDEIPRTK